MNDRKEKRLWSPVQASASTAGKRVKYIQWASDPIKDILARLRSGLAGEWLVPDDIDEVYQRQMNSEHKEASSDGRGTRWKRHQHDNHYWDCEAMAVFFSLYYRLMRVVIDIPQEVDSAAT